MSFRKLDTETRRRQIAQAAATVIAQHGLRGLRIGAVARQVGITPSAIYRHYRGKEQIVDAVLELFRDRLRANVSAVREATDDPLTQLQLLLERQVQAIRENVAMPRLVFAEELHAGRPGRRQHVREVLHEFLAAVAGLICEGQAQGRIRRDARPEVLALMFFGLFQPAGILWHLTEGEFDVTRHTEQAWRVFREAITPATLPNGGRLK